MDAVKRNFLRYVHGRGVLRFGEFTLKSGRLSPYFFNAGMLHSGSSLRVIGDAYAHTLYNLVADEHVLYGPAYKGIPLASATAIALNGLFNRDLDFCFNRKEIKDHGEGGGLVGADMSGRSIWIIDDVITAGTAINESVEIVTQAGGVVCGVCLALDRQEVGMGDLSAVEEVQEKHGVPVASVVNFSDLIEFCKKQSSLQKHVDAMLEYQARYGV